MIIRSNGILLVGALLAGSGAAYFSHDYIDDQVEAHKARLNQDYEPIQIVVPKENLRVGSVVSAHNLAVRPVPNAFVHDQAVRPDDLQAVLGHRLMHPVNSGEPVLMSHVSQKRGSGFSNLLDPGKRALTVAVDTVSSMAGLLRPGDRIDLLATVRDNDRSVTVPLLTNVALMATGAAVDEFGVENSTTRYQTITVSVTGEEAAKITHAQDVGRLSVVLRPSGDNSAAYMQPVTKNSLLGKTRPARGPGVEIIRGGKQ